MKRLSFPSSAKRAFTLLELLVTISIIVILTALLLPALVRARDAANKTACLSNLRQVGYVYHFYSEDNNNRLPSKDMLGNSSYRKLTDPLGLPSYFQRYIPTNKVWLCPVGRKTLVTNGVNYAWSRAQNLVGDDGSTAAFNKLTTTTVIWDNFTYALPSVFGVSESATGGPQAVNSVLRYYPHSVKRRANYLYLDGHVETK